MVVEGLHVPDDALLVVLVPSIYLFYYLLLRPCRIYILLNRLYHLSLNFLYLNRITPSLVLALYHPPERPIT